MMMMMMMINQLINQSVVFKYDATAHIVNSEKNMKKNNRRVWRVLHCGGSRIDH